MATREVRAPNFYRLAEECVVFENAYVTQPICTPSRSSVPTGLWPYTNGCNTNDVRMPAGTLAFPELLADPDYRTGYMGNGISATRSSRSTASRSGRRSRTITPSCTARGGTRSGRATTIFCASGDTSRTSRATSSAATSRRRLPIEHGKPRFLEEKATDFLRRHRHEPFLLHVNFLEPHPPYRGPFNDQHPVDEIELPPSYSIPLGDDDPLAYRIRRLTDRMLRPQGIDLSTDAGYRRLIANYWGNVTHIDRAVGGILRALEELGLADNTIVVYTADHGEMLGAHSMHRKEIMYEEAAKVPLLMRIPEQGRKQAIVKGRFSQLDVSPTLLELMGKPVPENLQGRSLMPAVRRGRSEEPVFIEWHGPPSQFPGDAERLSSALAELSSGTAEISPEDASRAIRANTRAR